MCSKLAKIKNILRILSGSRSCETIIFIGRLFTSEFSMTFNYSYFFTPSSLRFCKSIVRFYIMTCSLSHHICNRCAFLALMIIIALRII